MNLIVNPRVEEYDGTTAVTRSAHLEAEDIEFMRWKAERWMKVRHIPAAFRHDPLFVLRNGRRMLAHTFRGTSWNRCLGSNRHARCSTGTAPFVPASANTSTGRIRFRSAAHQRRPGRYPLLR